MQKITGTEISKKMKSFFIDGASGEKRSGLRYLKLSTPNMGISNKIVCAFVLKIAYRLTIINNPVKDLI